MLAEPMFQFNEELNGLVGSSSNTTSQRCGNNVLNNRPSLKRPSKLELKVNLNQQQQHQLVRQVKAMKLNEQIRKRRGVLVLIYN
jgi:hypothetical protein